MLYPRVSLYALMLAAAGIPLYIHLPRFATVNLGLSLGALGTLLILIRLVDLVQDPILGWLIDRWPGAQSGFALLAAAGLAVGFPMLFWISPGPMALTLLTAVLVLLFSAYSLGMILLYGRSATLAHAPEPRALMTLAAYREAGMLLGVILAAIAPALLAGLGAADQGYPAFGLFLGAIAVLAAWATRPIWQRPAITGETMSWQALGGSDALRLLLIALINSLPVALTSTLFLFFVEDRLQLVGQGGPLLVLFFLTAGLCVPLWARLSQRVGGKATLLIAMPLAILGFVGAGFLAPGNLAGFALICVLSGAALAADLVVLPALFSIALTRARIKASAAFGIWSFAGKLGLALAAFFALPLLERSGFSPGQVNTPEALSALTFAYVVLPCLLKVVAFGCVLTLPSEKS